MRQRVRLNIGRWNRIASVICMIPVHYGRIKKAEASLLALTVTGEASNHWPQTGVGAWVAQLGSANFEALAIKESM